jgi:hypothetical protein
VHPSEIFTRKIAGLSKSLSRVRIEKDAVSRLASHLIEEQRDRRERSLVLQVVCAGSIVMIGAVRKKHGVFSGRGGNHHRCRLSRPTSGRCWRRRCDQGRLW